jgi:putative colanic acid biosynthesis acetyltransferase WcaF
MIPPTLPPEFDTARQGRLVSVPSPSLADKLRRLFWGIVQATLFRWSPIPLHGWRRMLLRLFGAHIGARARPYPDATIWAPWHLHMADDSCIGPRVICYSVTKIYLGRGVIISQGSHLCAASHDFRVEGFPLTIGAIHIAEDAWVAADAFVGPGVTIGARSVLGARGVAFRDIPPGKVAVGNPAKVVGER